MIRFLVFCLFLSSATATVYLTNDDFKARTHGTKALVAFKAPWCGHCKKLKPIWDELSEKVEVLIGEVDCTVEKELCQKHKVQGYPTIKYSTGFGWKSYKNGRDLEAFETFVDEKMQDGCLDDEKLCSDEEKQELERYTALSMEELHAKLESIDEEKENAEVLFKGHTKKLQEKYQTLTQEKEFKLEELDTQEAYVRYVLNKEDTKQEL